MIFILMVTTSPLIAGPAALSLTVNVTPGCVLPTVAIASPPLVLAFGQGESLTPSGWGTRPDKGGHPLSGSLDWNQYCQGYQISQMTELGRETARMWQKVAATTRSYWKLAMINL
jgi:hypothetical protein